MTYKIGNKVPIALETMPLLSKLKLQYFDLCIYSESMPFHPIPNRYSSSESGMSCNSSADPSPNSSVHHQQVYPPYVLQPVTQTLNQQQVSAPPAQHHPANQLPVYNQQYQNQRAQQHYYHQRESPINHQPRAWMTSQQEHSPGMPILCNSTSA